MLDLIITIVFIWLFFKVLGLVLKAAWSVTKFIASLLMTIAVPLLIGCLIFAGGMFLLIPVILIAVAFGLLKAAV